VVKRYPHTATISYYDLGTTNSIGVWTPGTLNTIGIVCNIQPNSTKYIVGESGDTIGYNWFIMAPVTTGVGSVPDAAKLTFFSKEHVVLQLFEFQKHMEIKC